RHIETEIRPFQEYFVFNGNHFCTDNSSHATPEEHTGQCYDKGLDSHIGYQEALNNTEQKADHKGNQNRHIGADAVIFHKVCHYHTYQGGYGTYGNIDTACDHYDGKTAGNNQKTRVGYKQVQKHLRFRKSLVCKYDHTC